MCTTNFGSTEWSVLGMRSGVKELFHMQNFCRLLGFTTEQTVTLITSTLLEYSGKLHSQEHGRNFTASCFGAPEPTNKNKLVLTINCINVSNWFNGLLKKLNQSVRMKQGLKIVRCTKL